jgi:chemosensory pili system protein ChpC
MTATIISVPCLMIPVEGEMVLLPNAAIAEIVGYSEPEQVDKAPNWLLGLISWRGYKIPLLSYEALTGGEPLLNEGRVRIAVVNTLKGSKAVPFFGIVTRGIPKLTQANQGMVINSAEEGGKSDSRTGVLQNVLVHGNPAVIPDLDAIESLLLELPKKCLGGFYATPDVESRNRKEATDNIEDISAGNKGSSKKDIKKKVTKKKVVKKKAAKK